MSIYAQTKGTELEKNVAQLASGEAMGGAMYYALARIARGYGLDDVAAQFIEIGNQETNHASFYATLNGKYPNDKAAFWKFVAGISKAEFKGDASIGALAQKLASMGLEEAADEVKVFAEQERRHGEVTKAILEKYAPELLEEKPDSVYQFTVKGRKGEDVSLADYKGKVLLIVNTATRCGFTPQYEGLEWMYEQHKDKGFEILDFPCNQFGQQAPGTDDEIHTFCVVHYKTAFPQFAKIDVNGENAAPLFRFLTDSTTFEGFPQDGKLAPILEKMLREADPDYAKKPDVKWNFTKFLVGRDGRVVSRFEPTAPLSSIETAIEKALR